jgi:hypothetical protein
VCREDLKQIPAIKFVDHVAKSLVDVSSVPKGSSRDQSRNPAHIEAVPSKGHDSAGQNLGNAKEPNNLCSDPIGR